MLKENLFMHSTKGSSETLQNLMKDYTICTGVH